MTRLWLSLAAAVALLLSPADALPSGFIRVANGSFVDASCNAYIPVGWNSWVSLNEEAAPIAAGLPSGQAALQQSSQVTSLFQTAQAAGFTAVRLFFSGEDSSFQLQTSPGVNSEYVFRGIDYILATAGLNDVKAIVVPVNNWLAPGVGDGKQQYMAWAGLTSPTEDQFWTDPTVRQLIKNQLSALANRRNVFTGALYRDDPTIMAWDVYNEPRCPASQTGVGCPDDVTSFYADLSCYLKSVAPNQLVTTGEEGFFDLDSGQQAADPSGIPSNVISAGRYWAAKVGQDFSTQSALPCIDFAGFHLWPDNWNTPDPAFPATWIAAHEAAAASISKPALLEEARACLFGKGDEKQYVYQAVFGALQSSLASGGSLKGALFWRWSEDGGSDENTVYTGDPIYQLIEGAVAAIKPYIGVPVPGCSPAIVAAGAAG